MTDTEGRHEANPIASDAATLVATVDPAVIVDAATIVPTTSTKAIIGAVAAGVVAGLGAAATGLVGDMTLDPLEWVLIASATIVGAGLTGGGVYAGVTRAK